MQVHAQSGFNLLQAAVFEGEYNTVLNVHALLENFVEEMELVKTGGNARYFPGKTAVEILSLTKIRKTSHDSIERLYHEWAKEYSRLTELQWATCYDDAELAVELVLNDGVDINAPGSDDDCTALLQASRSSSSQFIETLINLGADVNAQRKEKKETPLILAANWNNYMAAGLLLMYGTDVTVQSDDGRTLLHQLVIEGKENLLRLLLQHNADVNIQDNDGCTPLRLSVILMSCENLVRLLLEHNADVNIQDKIGYTLLHWCALNGDKNLARLLLKHKADVNIQNEIGHTPLHQCSITGDKNLARLLLEHNADVNIQDIFGFTPLHFLVKKSNENFVSLLLKYNADVNIRDKHGKTLLHRLVIEGNENLVKLFLANKANLNIQDKYGITPLHQSVIEGDENLVRLLLHHNADVSMKDQHGHTPLHASSWHSHINQRKIIGLLVKHGAQTINMRDAKGLTPLHIAVRCGNAQAVKKLVDLGADVSLVKADKKDAVELELLKNEAELRERHHKFELGSALPAEETRVAAGDTFTQTAKIRTKSHTESKKPLKETSKDIEDESGAKQTQPGTVHDLESELTPF